MTAPPDVPEGDAGEPTTVHTVIFVDVDGVLNVGTRDEGCKGGPLLLNVENIKRAHAMVGGGGETSVCAKKVFALSRHPLGSEPGTFESLAVDKTTLSDVLVGRLAELVKVVHPQPKVVLSSSWRHSKHKVRAEHLRQEIERHLGREFQFDDATPSCEDHTAPLRLQCLGEYMKAMRLPHADEVRLLVLDDFFISPLRGWSCKGAKMDGVEDAEKYLLKCCGSKAGNVKVKVVHPYLEFVTGDGMLCQIGTGLTLEHFTSAMDFLMGRESADRASSKRTAVSRSPSLVSRVSSSTLLSRLSSHSNSSASKPKIAPEIAPSKTKATHGSAIRKVSATPKRWLAKVASALSLAMHS